MGKVKEAAEYHEVDPVRLKGEPEKNIKSRASHVLTLLTGAHTSEEQKGNQISLRGKNKSLNLINDVLRRNALCLESEWPLLSAFE